MKNGININRYKLLIFALLVGIFMLTKHANLAYFDEGTEVYFNDFEEAVEEWSNYDTDVTPIGQRGFLGQFGNTTVSLNLTDLPAHAAVTVSFDLFIIRSWDGNNQETFYGPDIWELKVRNGLTLLSTTFSNGDSAQSYPDSYPGGEYPGYSGSSEQNTLGYWHPLDWFEQDAVYQLSFTFEHSTDSLILDFSASGLQGVSDESWGLDNVRVITMEEGSNYDTDVIPMGQSGGGG